MVKELNTSYRPEIDGLRAISVVAVILYHFGFNAISGGFIGVDVFFVISGYLITKLIISELKAGTFSFSNFYERRARRLLPALFFVYIIVFLASYIIFSPLEFESYAASQIYSVLSVSNFYFWLESGYWDPSNSLKPLLHTWSLSVEEQFYLVWPSLAFVLYRLGSKAVLIGAVTLFIGSFLLNIFFNNDLSALYYLTQYRVFELALGAIMVWVYESKKVKSFDSLMTTLGIGLIIYSAMFFKEGIVFPSYNGLVPCIGAALIIYGGNSYVAQISLANRFMLWIGVRSYSMYLIHWPLFVFLSYWIYQPVNDAQKILLIFGTLFLSGVMYKYIETPFRGKAKLLRNWSSAAIGFVSSLVAIAIIIPSSITWAHNGLPSRLGKERLEALEHISNGSINAVDIFKNTISGGSMCPEKHCSFSNKEGTDAILVGRSHAQHYINGLVDSGVATEYWHVNCPVFFGEFCNNDKWATLEEYNYRNTILDKIKNRNETVIFSEVLRYSYYKCVKNVKTGNKMCFDNKKQYLDFIDKRVSEFKTIFDDRKIIWIGETPRVGMEMNSVSCISRPYMPDSCFTVPWKVHKEWRDLNIELAKIAKKNNIEFFNPHDVFCNDDGCMNFIDGKPVYFDSHHYTDFASKYAAITLAPMIKGDQYTLDIKKKDTPLLKDGVRVHFTKSKEYISFKLELDQHKWVESNTIVAFYLMKGGKKIKTRWYKEGLTFDIKRSEIENGNYSIIYFLTTKDNPHGNQKGKKKVMGSSVEYSI